MSFCKSVHLEEIDVTWRYIHSNPSYECYTSLHIKYLLCMMIPATLIWAILIPLVMYWILYKNRNQMGTEINNFKFGLMVEEYRPNRFYWELIKMTVKIILQIILILCENNIG